MRAPSAVARDCAAGQAPAGAAGIARRVWRAPGAGYLRARLAGGRAGDWDLALFRAGRGEPFAASTSVTSREVAAGWVEAGERITIQACRRAGGAASVPLALELTELERPPAPSERVSLESVAVSGPDDVATLERLGFDLTHDAAPGAVTAVLHSDAERARLAAAGFSARTVIADLAAHNAAERRAERRAARRSQRSDLPSGRDTYRVYSDYTTELKQLADANAGLVRSLVIGTSVEGRPIEGVEIAAPVGRPDDGRPVYLNFGAHHAREWPSAEFPLEFALDLVNGFNAGDPRITSLLGRVRVVIVPVVNPDGFIASRETASGENKRKNCRVTVASEALFPCELRPLSGVDLNRNYGAYWGGTGSSGSPSSEAYRGPEPFSEPEAQAVHAFSSSVHPTVFITNHTFTDDGKWLRQPGFDDPAVLPQDSIGSFVPDEQAMKGLGDAMGAATGWTSERAYETLGSITGATEDWNYYAQGTYGYTPEARGDGFHDAYPDAVVEEYLGDAQHQGLGVREAFLLAGERAAASADHALIQGGAPPGAELRLRKSFATPTYQQGVVVNDVLDTALEVPADGSYEWHVNPSGRPLVPGEAWTMSCTSGGGAGTTEVTVERGQAVVVDWSAACDPSGGGGGARARCAGRRATLVGTAGRDTLRGTPRRDVIAARGGNDRVRARGGNDLVCGGPGRDRISGGGGRDRLNGGGGRDALRGGPGRDRLRGGGGRDRLNGGGGRDRLDGGGGRDRCRAGRADAVRRCG